MILGLSRKVPRGETPLRDVSNSPLKASLGFRSAMDKCQRFLDQLKTPSEIRKMEEMEMQELDEPFYDVENVEPVQKNVEVELEQSTGHVDFGNLGFMSLGGDAIVDDNQNLDDDAPGEGNIASSGDEDLERPKSAVSATGTVSDMVVVEENPPPLTTTVEAENGHAGVDTEENVSPVEKCNENSKEDNAVEVNNEEPRGTG